MVSISQALSGSQAQLSQHQIQQNQPMVFTTTASVIDQPDSNQQQQFHSTKFWIFWVFWIVFIACKDSKYSSFFLPCKNIVAIFYWYLKWKDEFTIFACYGFMCQTSKLFVTIQCILAIKYRMSIGKIKFWITRW